MICKWSYGQYVYEFDADTKAEEIKEIRKKAKEWHWKFKDMKEEQGMYINTGYKVGVKQLFPHGTNSTMFTECCDCAICDDEGCCPSCGREVIGHDAETSHERNMIRWKAATAGWRR